jgi:hypothetical protein
MEDKNSKAFTVNDYLGLADWTFDGSFEEGKTGNLFWVIPKYAVDLEKFLKLPPNYKIVLLSVDCYGGAPARDPSKWTAIHKCFVSDDNMDLSEIMYDSSSDTSLAIISTNVSESERNLRLEKLGRLAESSKVSYYTDDSFWINLELLHPMWFWRSGEPDLFASIDKSMLDQLCTKEAIQDAEQRDRFELMASRSRVWENTELSEEKCIKPECGNLRMKLATLCFIHQQQRFAGLKID